MSPFLSLSATLLALASVATSAVAKPGEPSVRVEITALSAETSDSAARADAARLRGWLVDRLGEEGFRVLSDGEGAAELRLVVEMREAGWRLSAKGVSESSNTVDPGQFDLTALELLHKAVAALQIARQPSAPATAEGSSSERDQPLDEPGSPAERVTTEPPPAVAAPVSAAPSASVSAPAGQTGPRDAAAASVALGPWHFFPHFGVGWQQRGSAGDPRLDAGLDLTRATSLGVRAHIDVTWSPVPPVLGIWEVTALVGPTYRWGLSDNWALSVGVLGGGRWHSYRFESKREVVATWVALLPTEIWVRAASLHIGLGAFAGLSTDRTVHRLFGAEAWQRSQGMWGLSTVVGMML